MFKFQDYGIDKVVVLHLIEDKKREEFLKWQFKQLDIDTSNIEWHIAVRHPFGAELAKGINDSNKGRFTKPNEISCLREHYTIIKKAWYENCKNILVIEDDVRFNKDINFLKTYLENLPKDYNFCQGDGFTSHPDFKDIISKVRNDDSIYWTKHDGIGVWNLSFIIYDRNAMGFFLNFIDKNYFPADAPVYYAAKNFSSKINCYISKYPLVFQEDNSEIPSNIRPQETQETYQQNYNVYIKDIDKEQYFSYKEYQKFINNTEDGHTDE